MAHARRSLIAGLGVGTALVALVVLFAPFVVRAESAPAEQRVRFTVVSARAAAGLTYIPRTGQAATPLVLYPTARSPRYEYRGAMPLRITDAVTKSVIAEAMAALVVADALVEKFGGDSMSELHRNLDAYLAHIASRLG